MQCIHTKMHGTYCCCCCWKIRIEKILKDDMNTNVSNTGRKKEEKKRQKEQKKKKKKKTYMYKHNQNVLVGFIRKLLYTHCYLIHSSSAKKNSSLINV